MAPPTDAVLRSPRSDRRGRPRRGPGASSSTRGRAVTLEDRMIATWGQLATGIAVTCPVCAEEKLVDSGCTGCGAELS